MDGTNRGGKRRLASLEDDRDSRTSGIACSKDRPRCRSCLQYDRECHYSAPVIRSPLTRMHLDNVENRLRKLEELFARLLPDVDIEDALSSATFLQLPTQIPGSALPVEEAANEIVDSAPIDRLSETLPQEANGFDWKEEAADMDNIADGMGALSVEPSGIGYLGPTSGVVFLRSLLTWLNRTNPFPPMVFESSSPPQIVDPLSNSIPQIPDHLQSSQYVTILIDKYFANYHTCYPFVHEATFRAQYNGLVKRPDTQAWQMLLNTIIALGAWTCENENNDLDDFFYRKAISSWQEKSIFESGSLTLVQVLLLLSNYTQKRNKPNTRWNFLGLAVRMALSLGLHREMPNWNISLLQREMRRRVWCGLFIFDSGASMTFGRAILLPGEDMMDIKHVLNVPDELLTPLTETIPQDLDEPTLYSSLIAQTKFFLAANKISNRLLSSKNISAREALALNTSMGTWTTTIPWYFQLDRSVSSTQQWYLFGRSRLWWKYWNLQITLTRPFLLQWAFRRIGSCHEVGGDVEEENCKNHCISSAHLTITSIADYSRETPLTRNESWYTLYFLFHAALIPVVCLCAEPTSPDATSWREDVDKIRATLTFELAKNTLAIRCLTILDQLLLQPSSDGNDFQLPPFHADIDIGSWTTNLADPLNFLSWPEFGQDFA